MRKFLGVTVFPIIFLLTLATSLLGLGRFPGLPDDFFILLVYIRHFISGNGIYFNIQDGPLDAFTSFGDFVVKSFWSLIVRDDLVFSGFSCALFFFLAILFVLLPAIWSIKAPLRSKFIGILTAFTVGTSVPLGFGATFFLETPLYVFTALLALTIFKYRRGHANGTRILWVSTLVFLSLVRPEGGLVALTWLLLDLWFSPDASSRRKSLISLTIFICTLVAFLMWHWWFFGHMAPNSYYAKTSVNRMNEISDGLSYLRLFGSTHEGALLSLLAIIATYLAVRLEWNQAENRVLFVLPLAGVYCSIVTTVVSGGDPYLGSRFLALPCTLLLFALGYAAVFSLERGRQLCLCLLLVLSAYQASEVFGAIPQELKSLRRWPYRDQYFKCPLEVASKLRRLGPNLVVVQGDFQILKYFWDSVQLLDLSGLTDYEIAHSSDPMQVTWGKFENGATLALERPIDIWKVSGYLKAGNFNAKELALSTYTMRELAYEAGVNIQVPSTTAQVHPNAFFQRFFPASFRACNGYFNFFIKMDLAQRAKQIGIQVNTAE